MTYSFRVAKNIVSLKSLYASAPEEVRLYFEHFPKLLEDFPLDVALAYMFSRVELAHNMAIYCGVVKIHKADAKLARSAVEGHHMNRDGFRALFAAIYGQKINATAQKYIEEAESIRDKVMHGKTVSERDKRVALSRVLHYAVKFNEQTCAVGGFKPFGRLQGFKGRLKPLDKSTSRWILKGVGLSLS